jgi:hypothetical protein
LPEVLVLDFGHGHVVVSPQAILDAAKNLPLSLERGHAGQVKLNDAQTNMN